jgi:serine/threonine protein kinase
LFRKAFYTTGVEGAETLRLLVQERDYLRNLHHPNIVTFVGYEENEDHSKAYLWTEYCNGSDLSKFIRKDLGNDRIVDPNRKLTKREIWRIFSDIAAAVSYLHYGVIKENNLFSLKTDWSHFYIETSSQQMVDESYPSLQLSLMLNIPLVVVQNMPANVPTYKLCDLGIAKIWDPTINQTRKGRGTGPWMPKVRERSHVEPLQRR